LSFEIETSVGWEEYWYARIDDDSSKLQHVYIIKKNNNRIFLIKRDCRDQRMENRKSRHQKIVLGRYTALVPHWIWMTKS